MTKLMTISSYLAVGLLVGTVSALLGIGGGVLLVPALVLIWECSMHTAVGTSLVVIFLCSLAGAIRHYSLDNVNLPLALAIAVGAIVGSFFVGAPLAEMLPAAALKKIFGIVLAVVGLHMAGVSGYLVRLVQAVTAG